MNLQSNMYYAGTLSISHTHTATFYATLELTIVDSGAMVFQFCLLETEAF